MKRLLLVVALFWLGCAPSNQQTLPPTSDPGETELTQQPLPEKLPGDEYAQPTGQFAQPPDGRPVANNGWQESPTPAPSYDRAPSPQKNAPEAEYRGPMNEPPARMEKSERGRGDGMGSRAGANADTGVMGIPGTGLSSLSAPTTSAPPPPDDRPGLGTSWGETRYSAVNEVPFERDSGRPNFTANMHYNDERGANALAGTRSNSSASISLGSALSISLRDQYGSALPAYRGNGRTVAIGANGQRYSIVVQNHTNERFEVVLSVDGLDVLDGKDAGFAKRGYLIDAYATVEIDGFRQSQEAVAAFRFGAVGESYAAQTGSARNVGVIGAAAFGERGYMARLQAYRDRMYAERNNYREVQRRVVADPFPNKYANPPLNLAR